MGLLLLFFVLFNTPFIQARLYDYFAQNIEEKYSIKIDSDKFYYNFFSNELTTNFGENGDRIVELLSYKEEVENLASGQKDDFHSDFVKECCSLSST